MKIKNFLTFDLEYWYDSEFVFEKGGQDFILEGLEKVTKILNEYDTKATFFVTGEVLEKYPEQIKKLSEEGHEISSHSYEHKMLTKMSREEIIKNILKSKKLIKKIIGKNPYGFRAPSWSVSKKKFWVYDFLKKNGFEYSSSLFPINMGLYGDGSFPIGLFNPLKKEKFYEVPIRPFSIFGLKIPF